MKIFLSLFLLVLAHISNGQVALHIYGGQSHDVYLGCVNCNDYDKISIWNEYGTYGSEYNTKSIWNEYST